MNLGLSVEPMVSSIWKWEPSVKNFKYVYRHLAGGMDGCKVIQKVLTTELVRSSLAMSQQRIPARISLCACACAQGKLFTDNHLLTLAVGYEEQMHGGHQKNNNRQRRPGSMIRVKSRV